MEHYDACMLVNNAEFGLKTELEEELLQDDKIEVNESESFFTVMFCHYAHVFAFKILKFKLSQ